MNMLTNAREATAAGFRGGVPTVTIADAKDVAARARKIAVTE